MGSILINFHFFYFLFSLSRNEHFQNILIWTWYFWEVCHICCTNQSLLIFYNPNFDLRNYPVSKPPKKMRLFSLEPDKSEMLKIGESKTRIRNYDLEFIGVTIYNSLPDEIREIGHLKPFKLKLKKFLLSKVTSLVSPMQLSTRNKII